MGVVVVMVVVCAWGWLSGRKRKLTGQMASGSATWKNSLKSELELMDVKSVSPWSGFLVMLWRSALQVSYVFCKLASGGVVSAASRVSVQCGPHAEGWEG